MKTVSLDNDWEFEYKARRKNASTGEQEPAAGLTGLYGHFSATDAGAMIHATLRKPLAERSGAPGIYYAIAEGDDLRANLAPTYTGQVIFEVFGDGTNVLTSIPRRVGAIRRP